MTVEKFKYFKNRFQSAYDLISHYKNNVTELFFPNRKKSVWDPL